MPLTTAQRKEWDQLIEVICRNQLSEKKSITDTLRSHLDDENWINYIAEDGPHKGKTALRIAIEYNNFTVANIMLIGYGAKLLMPLNTLVDFLLEIPNANIKAFIERDIDNHFIELPETNSSSSTAAAAAAAAAAASATLLRPHSAATPSSTPTTLAAPARPQSSNQTNNSGALKRSSSFQVLSEGINLTPATLPIPKQVERGISHPNTQTLNRGMNSKTDEFAIAIKNNNIIKINELLAEGINPSEPILNSYTPLMEAVSNLNSLKSLQVLLQHPKIDLTSRNEDGLDALALAVLCGNEAAVKELLEVNKIRKTIYLSGKTKDGLTPLMIATIRGYDSILSMLLEADKSNIDMQNPKLRNYTALFIAVKQEKYGCAKILLDHGANLEMRDVENKKVIYHAKPGSGMHKLLTEHSKAKSNPAVVAQNQAVVSSSSSSTLNSRSAPNILISNPSNTSHLMFYKSNNTSSTNQLAATQGNNGNVSSNKP